MLCRNPYTQGTLAYGCGQCTPCRLNRRRLWTHRLMLEASCHEFNSFVTLTYNEENNPRSLSIKDCQLFLKRVRNCGLGFRYYVVGEYGDVTFRPHYHLAMFGVGEPHKQLLANAWGKGHIFVGTLTAQSAAYVVSYVTKRMTNAKDPRLEGRYPEFARMSLRPGIGAKAVEYIATALRSNAGLSLIERDGDVPSVLKHGKVAYPLGRYLRANLRSQMGFEQIGCPENILRAQSDEMLALYENAIRNAPIRPISFKEFVKEEFRVKATQVTTRAKIYASRKGVGL